MDQGRQRNKDGCFASRFWRSLRSATIWFYISLWPWSWWVPGSRSIKDPHQKRLKIRAQTTKRICYRAGRYSSKKIVLFLWWWSIFYWQVPFNERQYIIYWNNVKFYVFLLNILFIESLKNPRNKNWYKKTSNGQPEYSLSWDIIMENQISVAYRLIDSP